MERVILYQKKAKKASSFFIGMKKRSEGKVSRKDEKRGKFFYNFLHLDSHKKNFAMSMATVARGEIHEHEDKIYG